MALTTVKVPAKGGRGRRRRAAEALVPIKEPTQILGCSWAHPICPHQPFPPYLLAGSWPMNTIIGFLVPPKMCNWDSANKFAAGTLRRHPLLPERRWSATRNGCLCFWRAFFVCICSRVLGPYIQCGQLWACTIHQLHLGCGAAGSTWLMLPCSHPGSITVMPLTWGCPWR